MTHPTAPSLTLSRNMQKVLAPTPTCFCRNRPLSAANASVDPHPVSCFPTEERLRTTEENEGCRREAKSPPSPCCGTDLTGLAPFINIDMTAQSQQILEKKSCIMPSMRLTASTAWN